MQQPDISVFLPSKGIATGQAVVIFPGGGYRILAYDKEGTDIAKWLNSKGIAAVVVKYRLPISKSNIIPHKSPCSMPNERCGSRAITLKSGISTKTKSASWVFRPVATLLRHWAPISMLAMPMRVIR